MSGIHWYILDTETSGLMIGNHEICEYSVIRCADKVQLSRQIKVDKPENANADALRITGKTIADLKMGIGKKQAIEDFNEFIEQDGLTPAHRCIIAHNASFDRRFMHHLWKQYGFDFPCDLWLDTIPMAKKLTAQMGQPKAKVKLEAAMDLFGLKKEAGLHTAKGDTRNTYHLWNHLISKNIPYLDLVKQFPARKIEEITEADMADFE